MVNYYAVLDLSENATEDDIRKAYRRLAKKFHPDVNSSPDAQGRFVLIHKAYEVLIDRQQRFAYDQKFRTPKDSFQEYASWIQAQHKRQEEENRKHHQEFLRRKKQLKESKLYYPYMVLLYISTIVLVSISLLVLVVCAFAIVWYHVLMFFFMLPFICLAAYVLKVTLDEYKKYKALFL